MTIKDPGQQFLSEWPLGKVFYSKVSPDGVNGTPIESEVIGRQTHWGLMTVEVECRNGMNYSMTMPYNWWGYLRMWCSHTWGRVQYLWHTYVWKTR